MKKRKKKVTKCGFLFGESDVEGTVFTFTFKALFCFMGTPQVKQVYLCISQHNLSIKIFYITWVFVSVAETFLS